MRLGLAVREPDVSRARARWALVAAIAACVPACSSRTALENSASTLTEPPKDSIAKTTDNGPVKVETHTWPAKPSLDDAIYLRLDITAPAGVTVTAPFQEAGDDRMGRFRVINFGRDTARSADGGSHETQLYTLEAPSSGKHRIPPLRLEMVDARGDAAKAAPQPTGAPGAQEILTDEIPIDVAPVKDEAAHAELRPAAGTLDPNVGGVPWATILLLVSALAVVVSGSVLMLRTWRQRRRRAQQRSAYDDAIAKLSGLEARGAPTSEDADAWFVELSAIARTYIERRYEIRAPELTTEEFLQEAARGHRLRDDHRALLSSFLARCDRVKFAGYRPDPQESLDSLAAARAFVEDTRVREDAKEAA
jgi:hypothetical protein